MAKMVIYEERRTLGALRMNMRVSVGDHGCFDQWLKETMTQNVRNLSFNLLSVLNPLLPSFVLHSSQYCRPSKQMR